VFSCQSDSIYVFAFEQHCQHIAAVDVQKQTGSTVTSPTTPTSAAPSSLVIQVTVSIVAAAKKTAWLQLPEISWKLKLPLEKLEISSHFVDAPGKFYNYQSDGTLMSVGRSSSSHAHL